MAERILVLDDLPAGAADLIGGELRAAIGERGVASIVLAGGGTPLAAYAALAAAPGINWARVHLFWGDERLVPPDDPGSNYRAAWQALIRNAPIPDDNVHRVRGEWPAEAAVADYAGQLQAWACLLYTSRCV